MVEKLRIGLDIDDTLVDFWGAYISRFSPPTEDHIITRNVYKLRKDKNFWENLEKLRDIDFIPELYCTKRINSKRYTINSLKKHGFPSRPIYQMYYQKGNKADMIKGKVDIFKTVINTNYNTYNLELRNKTRREFGWTDNIVIGHIGKFNYQKNQNYLIRAFEKLSHKDGKAILLLVGNGPFLSC